MRPSSATEADIDGRGQAPRLAVVAIVAVILLGGLVGLSLSGPRVSGTSVSLTLYGTATGGWSFTSGGETNPGPTIVTSIGDNVTIHMVSQDAAAHGVFIDFNDDGHIEIGSDVSSPTGMDVTFSFIVPASPGSHYYYCSIHSPSAQGHYAPGGMMYGVFSVNANPSAAFSAPAVSTSWTGGFPHAIRFDLTDEDPPSSLTVWVNYSYGGGAQGGTIAGPIAGTANPNVLGWTPNGFSATDVRISVAARDTHGAVGTSRSDPFEIDSTAPTISVRIPAPNAVNVPVNTNVHVTWSEGMSETASGAPDAFAVRRVTDGSWIAGGISWSPDGTQVTFTPVTPFDPMTAYGVFVNATAKDDSDPGNLFAGPESLQFTTGSSADTTAPTILSVAANPSTQVAGGVVAIRADVTDDTSVASATAHVVGPTFDANWTMVSDGGTAWYTNQTYATPGSYNVVVWAVDGTGNIASRSGSFSVSPAPIPAPTGVQAHPLGDGTIHVLWSPVASGTIAGYNVYRSISPSGPFTKLTAAPVPSTGPLFYIDRDVQPSVTYYYVVTAVNVGGNESPQSAATSVRISGSPPPPPAPDYTLWIVGAGGIAAVAVAAALVVRRRKT